MRRIGALLLALIGVAPALAAEPAITPRPAHVVEGAGPPVALGDGTRVVAPAGDAEAKDVAAALVDLSGRTGRRLVTGTAATGPAIRLVRRPGLSDEGYAIDVGADGATIAATTRTGLFYGAVSLWQMLAAAPDGRLAPVHIDDAPRFRWRGLVLDSVRHIQSYAAIERMIDWMALHKLNRLQWHLADDQGWRLEIKRYPRLQSVAAWRSTPPAASLAPGRYGGFFTQDQARRLVAYAARRGVTIVPEIEMPGHATAAVLAYPEIGYTTNTPANLGDWGIFPSIYGVGEPTFVFLRDVLDEVMALFPSREIAIGGDEAVHKLWKGSPAVHAKMRALGIGDEAALQGWFVGRIGAYLDAHGRRLVGWDEILADRQLAPADVVLSWHGADGALAAARAGHDVVMVTAPTLYLDRRQSAAATEPPGQSPVIGLADVYGFDPADPPRRPGAPPLNDAARAHILGLQGALWSEYIATDARLEAMALPRAAALAESGWTAADRRDWPDFERRLPGLFRTYRALGLSADDGTVAVRSEVRPGGKGVQVTLARQLDLGELRYTVDGSAPTARSPRYAAPLDLPLPVRVRAASFAGTQPLSRAIDLSLDAVSATRKLSQQLARCSEGIVINLPGRASAAGAAGPDYLLDIRNPCWIDRDVDLSHAGHVAVGVAALPYNYQFADEATAQHLPPTATPAGELIVRRGCDGPVLATVPLAGVRRDGSGQTLAAAIPPQTGRGDLCLKLARPTLDPVWALGWVELRP